MKKSIILEGPNGAGKSTLGKALSDSLFIDYVHAGPSPGNFNAAMRACYNQCKQLERGVVLDRCTPISRVIYETDLMEFESTVLGTWYNLMEEHAFLVYCHHPGNFTPKDYYPPGHFEDIVSRREDIRSRYEALMSNVLVIRYDWTQDTPDDILARIHDGLLNSERG